MNRLVRSVVVCLVVCFFLWGSNAFASEHCVVLGGQTELYITLDADGTIHGDTSSYYTFVGRYIGGYAFFSISYDEAATRPVHHMWEISTMTGEGRARNADGSVGKWEYTISMCPASAPESDGADGFDVILGR